MKTSISVRIPEELKQRLDQLVDQEQMSKSQAIRKALQTYLNLKKFHQLRKEMIPHAEKKGVFTDQDVFDEVS